MNKEGAMLTRKRIVQEKNLNKPNQVNKRALTNDVALSWGVD
jgi:hypothetical protein